MVLPQPGGPQRIIEARRRCAVPDRHREDALAPAHRHGPGRLGLRHHVPQRRHAGERFRVEADENVALLEAEPAGDAAVLHRRHRHAALGAVEAELLGEGGIEIADGGAGEGLPALEDDEAARRIVRRRGHRGDHGLLLPLAPEREARRRVHRQCGHPEAEVLGIVHLVALDRRHDVAHLDAGLGGRAARHQFLHQDAHGMGEAQALGDLRGDGLAGGAEPGAHDRATGAGALQDRPHHGGGNGEADADGAAAPREDRGVDAHELAVEIHQGAAGIAGVDGGVGLDEGAEVADADGGAGEAGDDAAGHGLADAEGIADRQHEVADLKAVAVAHLEGRHALAVGVDLEDREVGALVGAQELRLELLAVGENDGDPERRVVAEEAAEDRVVGEGRGIAMNDPPREHVDHRRRHLLDDGGEGQPQAVAARGHRARRRLGDGRRHAQQNRQEQVCQALRHDGGV